MEKLTYESAGYEILSFLGEEAPKAVSSYVEEQSAEILASLEYRRIYRGAGAGGDLPKEVWRNIKNRDPAILYQADTQQVAVNR